MSTDDLKAVRANRLEQMMHVNNEQSIGMGSVGAPRKVSPYWSQETMTCHSSNCFSIV